MSLCRLCAPLFLCGENDASKTFTTEAQRSHREPQNSFSDRLLKRAHRVVQPRGSVGHVPTSRKTDGVITLVGAAARLSLKSAGRVLGLFRGSFGIEWDVDELLRCRLRVIIVAAGLQSFVVFINGFGPITFGVVGVAALDMGPGFNPRSFAADPVDGRLEI